MKEPPSDRPLRLVVGIADVVPKELVRHLLAPAFQHEQRLSLACHEDQLERLLGSLA